MTTLSDRYARATDPAFIARTTVAITVSATQVAAEDPANANHATRRTLASKVVRNPNGWAPLFALAAASEHWSVGAEDQATDITVGDDAGLQFVINSLWDAMADPPGA